MSVTIYDIARKAKVSHSTVSRVLSGQDYGKRKDSLERARRILEIAAAEGYQPNTSARALVGKQTHNICFLMSDDIQSGWNNSYYAQLLNGVEDACQKHNYGLILNRFNGKDFRSFFSQRKLAGGEFDGIVIAGDVTTEMREKMEQYNLPFISINRSTNNLSISDSEFKFLKYGLECRNNFDLIAYAKSKGHHNIGFVLQDNHLESFDELKLQYAESGTVDCNLIPLHIKGANDFASGAGIIDKWLKLAESDRPTLIFSSYQSSISIIKAMKKHGLSCPDDLSLVSNCDSEVCAVYEPGITVISPDNHKRGYFAAMSLIINFGKKVSLRNETCETIIIERKSVKDLSAV